MFRRKCVNLNRHAEEIIPKPHLINVDEFIRLHKYLKYLKDCGKNPEYKIIINGIKYMEVPEINDDDNKPIDNGNIILISESQTIEAPKDY
jgi:hypothetical protein